MVWWLEEQIDETERAELENLIEAYRGYVGNNPEDYYEAEYQFDSGLEHLYDESYGYNPVILAERLLALVEKAENRVNQLTSIVTELSKERNNLYDHVYFTWQREAELSENPSEENEQMCNDAWDKLIKVMSSCKRWDDDDE